MKREAWAGAAVTAGLILSTSLAGQDAGVPPDSAPIAAFAPLIGEWFGEGIGRSGVDGTTQPWTAVNRGQWIFGGQFVQVDMRVEMPALTPTPMMMRTIYGHDAETGRFHAWGVSNMGPIESFEVFWPEDDTLLFVAAGVQRGTPYVERGVQRYQDDSFRFEIDSIFALGKPFTQIEGDFKRKPAVGLEAIEATDAAFAVIPPAKEQGRLAALLGTWEVQGSERAGADAEPEAFGGRQEMRTILGGAALMATMPGADGAHQALSFLKWNDRDQCYDHVWFGRRGDMGTSQARWVDERTLSLTGTKLRGGQRVLRSGALQLHPDGDQIDYVEDWIVPLAPGHRAMTVRYRRVE
ncbi:MAG: DUF1579 family protein [Planctomycetota bacterium]